MEPSFIGLIVLVALNIVAWVFAAGKMTGMTNTRLNNVEKRLDDPKILPQCMELFNELKDGLSTLNGEVKALLLSMKEYQKNDEKRRIRNEG